MPTTHLRRGNATTVTIVTLSVLMASAALAIDVGYSGVVQGKMEAASDAAALAAAVELDGTSDGTDAAVDMALEIAFSNDFVLDREDVVVGSYDADNGFLSPVAAIDANAIRVNITEDAVGLGFSQVAFAIPGIDLAATATALGLTAFGDDPDDELGVHWGHFDFDTISQIQPLVGGGKGGGKISTDKHTHEYDNAFDITYFDSSNPLDGHHSWRTDVIANSCSRFKITVTNADLTPGIELKINGQTWLVEDYATQTWNDLPEYSIASLSQLVINYGEEAIKTGELHPTNTGRVRGNTAGAFGEWRNGALTVQLISTTGTINQDVPAFGGQGIAASGLCHSMITFWHWGGPDYQKYNEWLDYWPNVTWPDSAILVE